MLVSNTIKKIKWAVLITAHLNIYGQKINNFQNVAKINNSDVLNSNGSLVQKHITNFLFFHLNAIEDTLVIGKLSPNQPKIISKLYFDFNLKLNKEYLVDFDFRNDTALILLTHELLLFKLQNNVYKLAKKEKLQYSYDNCYINDNRINISKCYNFHILDSDFPCGLTIYDLDLNKIKTTILKTDCIPFTHLVSKYLDYNNGKFVLANALTKNFEIYNNDGVRIDSIGDHSPLNSNIKLLSVNMRFDEKCESPKDSIYKLQKFDKSINRIQKVYFINDSILLYTIKTKTTGFESYTLRKKNNKWLEEELLQNFKSSKKFSWAYSFQLHFYENKFYFIEAKLKKIVTDNHFLKFPNFYLYSYDYKLKPKK
jgi:hypothetical protein